MTQHGSGSLKPDTQRGVRWEHLSREDLDQQLSPSQSAKDASGTLARHARTTAALLHDESLRAYTDVPYGEDDTQRFDLYVPRRTRHLPSCVVFIHGGFWQEGDKAGAGFAARQLTDAGWALATIGYTLAPHATLAEIVDEIALAIDSLKNRLGTLGVSPDGLVLAGHSAGAHLAAAIIAGAGGGSASSAVSRALLISGVYDLAPIAASYVNDVVGMNEADIARLSPLLADPAFDIPVQLVIGADEPDAFQLQTSALYNAWKPLLSDLSIVRVAGRDHFDVLDGLASYVL